MALTEWKYELIESATMDRVGYINQARSKRLEIVHNRSGGASFTVPLSYDLFSGVEPVKHGIVAYRNDVAKWSGMIMNIQESFASNRMQVTCVGWFEILNRRKLRFAQTYPRLTSPPTTMTGGDVVFDAAAGTPGTPTYYPGGLLTIANAQHDTWITAGANTDKMERATNYEEGQSIGEAITALSESEAGFDWTIHPTTRVMTIKNWNQYADRRDDAFFSFQVGGMTNIQDAGRQIDGSPMNNRHTSLGTFGGGMAEDLDSQDEYQLFEEYSSIPTTDPNVLLGYAGAEVILRSTPRVLYNVQPFPYTPGRSPEPFDAFNVGDMVSASFKRPPRVEVEKQNVRVFGMSLSISEEGNEKLDALQVTPT